LNNLITLLTLLCVTAFAQQKGSFKDSRDGKTYKTVKIGNQVWMAENLNYNAKGSKCYGNKPANCEKYGRLYDEKTSKNVCPAGWHLPMEEEWNTLYKVAGGWTALKSKNGWDDDSDFDGKKIHGNGEDKFGFAILPGGTYGWAGECGDDDECYGFGFIGSCTFFSTSSLIDRVGWKSNYYGNICSSHDGMSAYAAGGEKIAGKHLKSVSGWNENGNGDDTFGFSAIPSGAGLYDGGFGYVSTNSSLWSASETNSSNVYYRDMGYDSDGTRWGNADKNNTLFSVRCLHD